MQMHNVIWESAIMRERAYRKITLRPSTGIDKPRNREMQKPNFIWGSAIMREKAYRNAARISFEGMHMRKDIGIKYRVKK